MDAVQIIVLRSLKLNPLTVDVEKGIKDSSLDNLCIDFPTFVSIYDQLARSAKLRKYDRNVQNVRSRQLEMCLRRWGLTYHVDNGQWNDRRRYWKNGQSSRKCRRIHPIQRAAQICYVEINNTNLDLDSQNLFLDFFFTRKLLLCIYFCKLFLQTRWWLSVT